MENILIGFASKTLGMTEQQVAELVKTDEGELKPDALKLLIAEDKKRIDARKAKETEMFDNGHSKGVSETMSKFEKEVKDKYGFNSDSKGVDLIAEIIEKNAKPGGKVELTPEAIKKSSTYIDAINKLKADNETAINSVKQDYEAKIGDFQKKEAYRTVGEAADKIVNSLNPIFSKNLDVAANQRKQIHKELQSKNFQLNDDGKIVPLKPDGKPLEDDHGHPVSFETVVRNVTTGLFDLNESSSRGSGGDEGAGGGGGEATTWSGTAPKTEKEYMEMISKAKDLDEKKAITEAWDKVNGK